MRPTLAAVMPLPNEEVTPPVTKTYFAMGRVLRGFFECYRTAVDDANPSQSQPRDGRPIRVPLPVISDDHGRQVGPVGADDIEAVSRGLGQSCDGAGWVQAEQDELSVRRPDRT